MQASLPPHQNRRLKTIRGLTFRIAHHHSAKVQEPQEKTGSSKEADESKMQHLPQQQPRKELLIIYQGEQK